MTALFFLKRTATSDPDFQSLIRQLDNELWNELKEDQATYDPHNKVENIQTAIVLYVNDEPVASGCFKPFDGQTVEIKRMFVRKEHRGKGLSRKVLEELERWALEQDFSEAVLETSIHFATACALYQSSGYQVIPNYGPYMGLEDSVCMRKKLGQQA